MSTDYLSVTVLSQPNEPAAMFSARLSQLWTQMLRERKDDFEKVYAETTEFEEGFEGRISRQYLVEASVADLLEQEFKKAGIDYETIDRDEVFSKYEATPSEWMWIEH